MKKADYIKAIVKLDPKADKAALNKKGVTIGMLQSTLKALEAENPAPADLSTSCLLKDKFGTTQNSPLCKKCQKTQKDVFQACVEEVTAKKERADAEAAEKAAKAVGITPETIAKCLRGNKFGIDNGSRKCATCLKDQPAVHDACSKAISAKLAAKKVKTRGTPSARNLFGHKTGSDTSTIDALFMTGDYTVKMVAEVIDKTVGRVGSHIWHLRNRKGATVIVDPVTKKVKLLHPLDDEKREDYDGRKMVRSLYKPKGKAA